MSLGINLSSGQGDDCTLPEKTSLAGLIELGSQLIEDFPQDELDEEDRYNWENLQKKLLFLREIHPKALHPCLLRVAFYPLSGLQREVLSRVFSIGFESDYTTSIPFNLEYLNETQLELVTNIRAICYWIKNEESILGNPAEEKRRVNMKKGEGLTGIMSPTSAVILRKLGIETVTQLTSLTTDGFIKNISNLKKHGLTVRAVVKGLLAKKRYFFDGERATKSLLDYNAKFYKPYVPRPGTPKPLPPAPDAQPPKSPSADEKKRGSHESAPPISGEKGNYHIFRKILCQAARDLIGNDADQENISTIFGFEAGNGRRYKITTAIDPM